MVNVPAQRPWWETVGWQNQPTVPTDPTTYPFIKPWAAFLGGTGGGPNWLPVASPLMNGPAQLNKAVGQGIVNGVGGTFGGLFTNPAGPQGKPPPPPGSPVWDLIGAENGARDPNARNPRSSAGGLGQFLDTTWMDKDLRKRAGYGGVDDSTWKNLRVGQAGVDAQIAMTAAYGERNGEQWSKAMGTPPTPGQTYGMHFLDAGPFILLTQKAATDPEQDAAAMFPEAAKANPEIFYSGTGKQRKARTAGELYSVLINKVPGGGTGDPFTYPGAPQMDPAQMAGMIPLPGKPRTVDLPDPALMPQVGPRPQQEELPVADWMAQLKALAPKGFDAKAANEGRLTQVLAGIAQGAAGTDASEGVGAMLAAMGAGGARAQAAWQAVTKQDKKEADEASRLFELGLVRSGIDFSTQNRAIRTKNAETAWEDKRTSLLTDYTNKANAVETQTREYLANNGILREYDNDLLGARTLRARTAMSVIEANVQATHEQLVGQAGMDLKRFLFQNPTGADPITAAQETVVAKMAAASGIDPKAVYGNNKDLVGRNALQGMAYIAAGQKQGAIASLAHEVILSGRYDLLPPDQAAKVKQLAMQDPDAAQAVAARLLNEAEADPAHAGTALNVARALAGAGAPFASTFLRSITPVGQNPAA